MQIDDRSFRKALACFATGVTVVTARSEKARLVGVTVNAFSSLSLDPPLVLFCLNKCNASLDVFRDSPFAVNVLRKEQQPISMLFASRGEDKWDHIDYALNRHGVPLIANSLAHLECLPHQAFEGGDHMIVVGRVEHLDFQTGGQPLVYFRGAYANLGEES